MAADPQPARPRVAIIGCGGTISTLVDDPLDMIDYLETGRKAEPAEILALLGDLRLPAVPEVVPYRSVSSSAIGPADWLALARTIEALAIDRPDLDGIVVIHGTGSIEETAYFLHLVLKVSCTVVLVGAQRPFNALSSDAPSNLLAAIRVAVEPAAFGLGVMLVMDDQIHCPREVTKSATYRLSAFCSPDTGPMGVVDRDRVVFYRRPMQSFGAATVFTVAALPASLPRVDISYAYAGADGAAVNAFVAAGARGIISAGFAPGMPPIQERSALDAARLSGVAVVQASRAGAGRVARRRSLVEKAWIGAGSLNPQKARILLTLALTVTDRADAIQDMFDAY